MKCEACKISEAVVHYKQVIDGDVRELHVCADCAAKQGIDLEAPLALTEFLFGATREEPRSRADETACPSCGLTLKAFRKEQRLGCPDCYEAFSEELVSVLRGMHGADKHVGKAPAKERMTSRIEGMRKAMDKAIAREDFEEAARLRDGLRDLQAPKAPAKISEKKVAR